MFRTRCYFERKMCDIYSSKSIDIIVIEFAGLWNVFFVTFFDWHLCAPMNFFFLVTSRNVILMMNSYLFSREHIIDILLWTCNLISHKGVSKSCLVKYFNNFTLYDYELQARALTFVTSSLLFCRFVYSIHHTICSSCCYSNV